MFPIVLLVVLFSGQIDAQRIFLGRCPDVTVHENFDMTQYAGTWYELERYFAIFEVLRDCVAVEYTVQEDDKILVNNTGLWVGSRMPDIQTGELLTGEEDPAKMKIRIPPVRITPDYWVLSTDYTSYAVVFSCSNFPILPFSTQFAWVFSRDPAGLSLDNINTVKDVLRANGIREEPFMPTQQTDCPGRVLENK